MKPIEEFFQWYKPRWRAQELLEAVRTDALLPITPTIPRAGMHGGKPGVPFVHFDEEGREFWSINKISAYTGYCNTHVQNLVSGKCPRITLPGYGGYLYDKEEALKLVKIR